MFAHPSIHSFPSTHFFNTTRDTQHSITCHFNYLVNKASWRNIWNKWSMIILLFGWERSDAKPWPNNEKRYLKVSSMIECMKFLLFKLGSFGFWDLAAGAQLTKYFCGTEQGSKFNTLLVVVCLIGQVGPTRITCKWLKLLSKKAQNIYKILSQFPWRGNCIRVGKFPFHQVFGEFHHSEGRN